MTRTMTTLASVRSNGDEPPILKFSKNSHLNKITLNRKNSFKNFLKNFLRIIFIEGETRDLSTFSMANT